MRDPIGEETLKIMRAVAWYNSFLFDLIKTSLGGKILEVGSGIGNFTELLATKGKVYATDYNRDYIKKLGKELPMYIKVGYGDIEKGKSDFQHVKFNTIVCMNVLEHIKDDNRALENMNSVLAKDGNLILLVPAFSWAYGVMDEKLGHFRRYSKNDLLSKLKIAGFKRTNFRYVNSIGLPGWFFNARVLERTLIPRIQLGIFNILARPFLILERYLRPPFGLSILVIAEK